MPSRTLNVKQLKRSNLWIHGPEFLTLQQNDWKEQPQLIQTNEAHEETKDPEARLDKVMVNTEAPKLTKWGTWLRLIWQRYSNPVKGLGVTACVYRAMIIFAPRYRIKTPERKNLSCRADRVHECLLIMIQQEQQVHLSSVVEDLHKNRPIRGRMAGWRPFFNSSGIVCITGRTSRELTRLGMEGHPILLTKAMPLATEIVRLIHEGDLKHVGGARMLLNKARETYWIEHGLVVAKQVLTKCAYCTAKVAKEIPYVTAPLHATRYQPTRTFETIGVDMFGPMEVTIGRGKPRGKRFAIIFTCCLTRAINVELVRDATAYSCFLAFKRHASTYGQPVQVKFGPRNELSPGENTSGRSHGSMARRSTSRGRALPTNSMGDESSSHTVLWGAL